MATALLLSSPLLHHCQKKQVSGWTINKFNSSFYGNLIARRIPIRRENIHSFRDKSNTIRSVLGRRTKVKRETVIPDPDYRIPIVLLGASGLLVYSNNLAAAVPVGLLGLLLLVQATRVRFVFDDEALEVRVGSELKESGENVFVGGKNRWKYSSFVNWEFWWPNFPILVYFKETQTKPEGQIHFFPIIFVSTKCPSRLANTSNASFDQLWTKTVSLSTFQNGKQLYDVMVERCGPSKTSGPKKN